jgi:hypothetical protein
LAHLKDFHNIFEHPYLPLELAAYRLCTPPCRQARQTPEPRRESISIEALVSVLTTFWSELAELGAARVPPPDFRLQYSQSVLTPLGPWESV